jgi:hypothetical protein
LNCLVAYRLLTLTWLSSQALGARGEKAHSTNGLSRVRVPKLGSRMVARHGLVYQDESRGSVHAVLMFVAGGAYGLVAGASVCAAGCDQRHATG